MHYTLHAFEHNFVRVFEESIGKARYIEFITAPVRIRLSNAVSMTHQWSPYPMPTSTNLSRTDSFRLLSRAIHAISDCLLPIDNHERLIRLCSSNDSINSSHRYSHALYLSIVLSRVVQLNHASCCHLRCQIV